MLTLVVPGLALPIITAALGTEKHIRRAHAATFNFPQVWTAWSPFAVLGKLIFFSMPYPSIFTVKIKIPNIVREAPPTVKF